jgi:NADH dehydrogenase FAD-containing subunit
MQQGRYLGKLIPRRVAGKKGLKPFRYFDKGNMAVVGKGYAILQSGKVRLHGLIAWFAWAFIHITFLAQLGLRISVFLQWAWLFLTGERGSRLIVEYHPSDSIQTARPGAADDRAVSQTPSATLSSK